MSSEELPVEVVLTDAIEEDLTAEVPIATSNPFRPTVYATENFLEELSNRLQNDVHMLPEGAVRRWSKEMQILLGSSKTGLIYMAASLAETLDLQLKDTNIDGVVFDACVIVCDHPVQILTFVRSVSKDKFDTLIQRNDELSKGVLYSLREFTDEKFNILNGVLDLDDLRDSAGFEDKRYKMFEKRSLYVNPRSLQMNPSKCRHLCKAFFVAAAVDHASTSSDKIVLLKWDDYQLLEKHLDEQKVIVNYASKQRAITLMNEVARRLSRSGKTVLRIKTRREVTVLHKTELATPYVADCLEDDAFHYVSDFCRSYQLPIINGKCWLFKRKSNGNPAEHLCGVCSLEMSADCKQLGRVLVDRKFLPEKILTGTFDWKCLWRYVNFAEELRSEFIDSIKRYSKDIARKLISDHDTYFHCTCKTLQTPSAVATCTLFSAETEKNTSSENTTILPHRTGLLHQDMCAHDHNSAVSDRMSFFDINHSHRCKYYRFY